MIQSMINDTIFFQNWKRMASSSSSSQSPTGDSLGRCSSSNSSNSDFKSDSDIKSAITCVQCRHVYVDARVLNCMHTFCLYCCEDMLLTDAGTKAVSVVCCLCKRLTLLKTGKPAELARNYGLNRSIHASKFDDNDGLICRSCKFSNPAESKCSECFQFLCQMCTSHHKSMKQFEGHHIVLLAEPIQRPPQPQQLCQSFHFSELPMASFYCFSCSGYYCDSCHDQHVLCKAVFFRDCLERLAENVRIDRNQSYNRAQYYVEGAEELLKSHQITLAGLKETKDSIVMAVEQYFSGLETQLKYITNQGNSLCTHHNQLHMDYIHTMDRVLEFISIQMKHAKIEDIPLVKEFLDHVLLVTTRPERKTLNLKMDFQQGNLSFIQNMGTVSAHPFVDKNCEDKAVSRPVSHHSLKPATSQPPIGNHLHRLYGTGSVSHSDSFSMRRCYSNGNSKEHAAFDDATGMGCVPYNAHILQSSDAMSPMSSSSLPNSACAASDNVFNFQNLSIEPTYGGSGGCDTLTSTQSQFSHQPPPLPRLSLFDVEEASSVTLTQVQNQGYLSWSNGVDKSQTPPINGVQDIFSTSNDPMFDAGTAPRLYKNPQLRRFKMQYSIKFGEYGSGDGQFSEPSGLAADAVTIYVADTNNSRIQAFDLYGNFKYKFGKVSNRHPRDQLQYPNRLAVARKANVLVITERTPTHRVQIFSLTGSSLSIFGENELAHPRGVCVDDDGNIIIVQCKVMQLTVFNLQGQIMSQFGCSKYLTFPNGVAVNSRREIFISDNRAHDVKVFSYTGEYLRSIGGEGITNYPIGVVINHADQVVVADNHNNFNITVFTQDGQLVAGFESKTKHAQCLDVCTTNNGGLLVSSKDYKVYEYRYMTGKRSPSHCGF